MMLAANAAISPLIALLIGLQAVAMPVVGVRIHRAIMLRGIYAVLVSRLVGALALRILGVLAAALAILPPRTLLYPCW